MPRLATESLRMRSRTPRSTWTTTRTGGTSSPRGAKVTNSRLATVPEVWGSRVTDLVVVVMAVLAESVVPATLVPVVVKVGLCHNSAMPGRSPHTNVHLLQRVSISRPRRTWHNLNTRIVQL